MFHKYPLRTVPFLACCILPYLLVGQEINFWYGPEQKFGHLGEPQRWINVLGNISEAARLDSATFSLNGGAEQKLSLGSDLHRLAMPGDFNVELDWNAVRAGNNQVQVTAYSQDGKTISETVRLDVVRGKTWPLPYYLDFTEVDRLQDVVQVVDGQWELNENGVRTVQRYYDRVLSMGDTTWSDFETTVKLTINDYTPSEPGPPTYNVTHFGVAMRWRGHHTDGRQPSRKWFPLGAQGEFLIKENKDSCQWRILFDGGRQKPQQYSGTRNKLPMGEVMWIKTQVATTPDSRTRYRFKQWADGDSEPLNWDVEGFESGDYPSGALCLVPHNSDVTIHEVRVEPLYSSLLLPSARPGPGAVHFSAPVGGVFGAGGQPFSTDLLQRDDQLLAVRVNLTPAPLYVIRALAFRIRRADGQIHEVRIGEVSGEWQEWHKVPAGARLSGVSGASGWYLDALQFHFNDGTSSPRYGGSGGDTDFQLILNPRNGSERQFIRGFHGTYTDFGLETIGLIFDPAE